MKFFLRKIDLPIYKIIIIGIILRLIVTVFATHTYDSFRILALSKSIADTGNLFDGFYVIGSVQLYGKIYYQIIAGWFHLLQFLHILDIRYLFDIRQFEPGIKYMAQFPYLGPGFYQLIAIKFVQFFFDFLLLFFLLKTSFLLNKAYSKSIVLFWAINPFFIYVGYVMLQSDLAMIAFMSGGVYLTLKKLYSNHQPFFSKDAVFALAFIAVGAVIKQVPLLLLPFVLFIFSESILQFIIYAALFAVFYLSCYQPWASDAILIKRNFLTSSESTALFNYSFNGITFFYALYFCVLGYFISIKQRIKNNPILFLYFVIIIIGVILVSEDVGSIFVQFNIWVMPFLALLALKESRYSIFLFGSMIGFYKRALIDTSVLIGSLALTFGEPLSKTLTHAQIVSLYFDQDVLARFMNTSFSAVYLLLLFFLIYELLKSEPHKWLIGLKKYFNFSLAKTTLILFTLFVVIGFLEYSYFSSFSQLSKYDYSEINDITVTKKPFYIDIDNANRHEITGLNIRVQNKGRITADYLVVKAFDRDTNKEILISKTSDAMIPDRQEAYFPLIFPHSINAKKIKLAIYKEKGFNNIVIFTSVKSTPTAASLYYLKYDNFYQKHDVSIIFPDKLIDLNILGKYTIADSIINLKYNLLKKPKFYIPFILSIIPVCILVLLLFIPMNKLKKDKKIL